MAIDHQFDVAADDIAHQCRPANITAAVLRTDLQFHRAQASIQSASGIIPYLVITVSKPSA